MAVRFRCGVIQLRGKALRMARFILLFAALAGVWNLFGSHIQPIMANMVAYRLRVYAVQTINEAVAQELEEAGISYTTLAVVGRDSEGRVTDIQTDVMRLNRLQADVTARILNTLDDTKSKGLAVTAGSLTGVHLLAGRGPMVHFRVTPLGAVETRLENQFQSAGINQTLHRMMLVITMEAAASNALCRVPVKVVTSVCVGETVIVGQIPQAYTKVEGSESGESSLFNYRAGEEMYQPPQTAPN